MRTWIVRITVCALMCWGMLVLGGLTDASEPDAGRVEWKSADQIRQALSGKVIERVRPEDLRLGYEWNCKIFSFPRQGRVVPVPAEFQFQADLKSSERVINVGTFEERSFLLNGKNVSARLRDSYDPAAIHLRVVRSSNHWFLLGESVSEAPDYTFGYDSVTPKESSERCGQGASLLRAQGFLSSLEFWCNDNSDSDKVLAPRGVIDRKRYAWGYLSCE